MPGEGLPGPHAALAGAPPAIRTGTQATLGPLGCSAVRRRSGVPRAARRARERAARHPATRQGARMPPRMNKSLLSSGIAGSGCSTWHAASVTCSRRRAFRLFGEERCGQHRPSARRPASAPAASDGWRTGRRRAGLDAREAHRESAVRCQGVRSSGRPGATPGRVAQRSWSRRRDERAGCWRCQRRISEGRPIVRWSPP